MEKKMPIETSSSYSVRPLATGMRYILLAAGGLVFLAGASLFIGSEQTDLYFVWTVRPPLTATVLGAAYWAACCLQFLAARQRAWAQARIAVPATVIFTFIMLIVSLIHLDRFHLNSPYWHARANVWFWLTIYAAVPPLMLVLLARQYRIPGQDPPRLAPLPRWSRTAVAIEAAIMLALGLALLIVPQQMIPHWPWTLTILTARAVGAWLIGLGVVAGQIAWENDLNRVWVAAISAVVFSVLQFVGFMRYPGDMNWSTPGAWVYLVFVLGTLALGLSGWLGTRRLNRGVTLT